MNPKNVYSIDNLSCSFLPFTGRPTDGVYAKDNFYIITFCHGDEEGDLWLQHFFGSISITPKNFRKTLQNVYNINISKKSTIGIIPCHPQNVMSKQKEELEKNNMVVIGDWEEITWFALAKNGEFMTPRTLPEEGNNDSFTLFFSAERFIQREKIDSEKIDVNFLLTK